MEPFQSEAVCQHDMIFRLTCLCYLCALQSQLKKGNTATSKQSPRTESTKQQETGIVTSKTVEIYNQSKGQKKDILQKRPLTIGDKFLKFEK